MNTVPDLTQTYLTIDKATAFAGWAAALMLAGGDPAQALSVFENRYGGTKHAETVRKAVMEPGTANGWGEALVNPEALANGFLDYIRPRTVLGRLKGTIAAPFDIQMVSQSEGFGVGWVAPGKPVLVSKGKFDRVTLGRSKIAGIAVMTNELVRSSDPAAKSMVTRDLSNAVVQFSDEQFLDPTIAEVADTSPASITYGAPEITSTGDTAAAVEADIADMVSAMALGGASMAAPYFVMKPTTAVFLAQLRTAGGQRVFPDVGPLGGTLLTIPVLVSASAGDQITLIDASHILVAEGGIDLLASEAAALQLDSDPGDGHAELVSLWQENLTAVKATRYIRWSRAVDAAVIYMKVDY